MTEYSRGDIVLISFVFTDETGERRRPAVIVNSDTYQRSHQETIIAAITSRTDRILVGDHLIKDWEEAGLLFPSVVTGIIRTIKQGMITRKLGAISKADMEAVNDNLRAALSLS